MKKKKLTAEEIAKKADRGEDVTSYMGAPKKSYATKQREKRIQRTNIDFGLDMLNQLDLIALKLNISRQSVVKMALQEYLTRYSLGQEAFKKASKQSAPRKR